MTVEFEADLDPDRHWPHVRSNFSNRWSASIVLRTEIGETEATAEEAAAYFAAVAARPSL